MNVGESLSRNIRFTTLGQKLKWTDGDHGRAVLFLELSESASVDNSCDDITHVKWLASICANYATELRGRVQWVIWSGRRLDS